MEQQRERVARAFYVTLSYSLHRWFAMKRNTELYQFFCSPITYSNVMCDVREKLMLGGTQDDAGLIEDFVGKLKTTVDIIIHRNGFALAHQVAFGMDNVIGPIWHQRFPERGWSPIREHIDQRQAETEAAGRSKRAKVMRERWETGKYWNY